MLLDHYPQRLACKHLLVGSDNFLRGLDILEIILWITKQWVCAPTYHRNSPLGQGFPLAQVYWTYRQPVPSSSPAILWASHLRNVLPLCDLDLRYYWYSPVLECTWILVLLDSDVHSIQCKSLQRRYPSLRQSWEIPVHTLLLVIRHSECIPTSQPNRGLTGPRLQEACC